MKYLITVFAALILLAPSAQASDAQKKEISQLCQMNPRAKTFDCDCIMRQYDTEIENSFTGKDIKPDISDVGRVFIDQKYQEIMAAPGMNESKRERMCTLYLEKERILEHNARASDPRLTEEEKRAGQIAFDPAMLAEIKQLEDSLPYDLPVFSYCKGRKQFTERGKDNLRLQGHPYLLTIKLGETGNCQR